MSDAELERLEREVEAARARVAVDLARLREPGASAELKDDVADHVSRTKDQLLDSAKETVRNRSESLMSEIRARVAANPGAALAIGAGLAWRLYCHPPVATLLVGAGLYGLARTDPHHPAMGAGAAAHAAELAETARSKTEEWRHRDIAGRIGDRAAEASQRAGEMAEGAGERLGSLADAARDRLGAAAEAVREQVPEWRSHGGNGDSRYAAAPRSGPVGKMPVPEPTWAPEQQRDRYLLGAAAVAMAAAVGVAAQRRFSEEATANASDPTSRRLSVSADMND